MTRTGGSLRICFLLGFFFSQYGCEYQTTPTVYVYKGKGIDHWMNVLVKGTRADALEAVEALAALAPESIPVLVEKLREPEISNEARERIIHVFMLLGPDGVQGLEALLKDPSHDVRWRAAKALGELGNLGIPGLIIALEDPDESIRRHAAYYLMGMYKEAKPALPALVRALKDDSPKVRSYAAQAIGLIGSPETSALEALRRSFDDADGAVCIKAARAFLALAPDTKETLPVLVRGLKDPVKYTRSDAAKGLTELGERAAPALDVLIESLKDPDQHVRQEAAEALGNLGPLGAPAVPALESLWKENLVDLTQRAVARALCKIERRWLDQFIRRAASGDIRSRARAIAILGGTGKYGQAAIPALEACLKDDSEQVRGAAELALKSIRGE